MIVNDKTELRLRFLSMLRAFRGASMPTTRDALKVYLTEDARFRLIGEPAFLTFAGLRVGLDAIASTLREINTYLEFHNEVIDDVLVDGDRVALRWRSEVSNRGTGETVHLETFDYVRYKNGLVYEYTSFFDSQKVSQIAHLRD